MSKRILCGIALILLLLSGCASSPDVQLVELSKNTVVYDEIVRINNCGGKGDSEQTKSRDFATTVEFGAGVSAGYQSIVQGSLSAKYSEYRNTSVSQRLVAPPGTNMEFVLRWSDDVRAGNVQVNGNSGTYEVRIPVSVEQVSSRDLGCGVSAPIPTMSNVQLPTQSASSTVTPQTAQRLDYIDRFRVTANIPKNRTGVWVNVGDTIYIEYLDGQWTGEKGKQPPNTGCGFYFDDPYSSHIYPLDPKQNTGAALIAYIGTRPFLVGCKPLNSTATTSGELYLGMNDCQECFWDNDGEIYVRISITRK